jgi:hypothetical protein
MLLLPPQYHCKVRDISCCIFLEEKKPLVLPSGA